MTAHLSKDPRKQVIGVLKAGSTVNDITQHFDCSRQTIHDLMNRYNSTASVRVRARPGCTCVTTLRSYRLTRYLTHVIISTSNHYCSAFARFMHKRSLIISCKIKDLTFSSVTMQGLTQRVNNHVHKITSTSCLSLLYPKS